MDLAAIADLPVPQASHPVGLRCAAVPRHHAHLPPRASVFGPYDTTGRCKPVLDNLQRTLGHRRLRGAACVSILPIDQGIDDRTGASLAPNPYMFVPEFTVA